MRKIQTQDVFKMAQIIRKANIKEELAAAVTKNENGETKLDGTELVLALPQLFGIDGVDILLYELIAGIAETKPAAVKTMDFNELLDLLKEIAKDNDLERFFGIAIKSA